MGRSALAIGGIGLIGAGVAIGLGWWWPSSADAEARITEPIHTVRIDVPSSDVRIRTGDVSVTTVRQRFGYRGTHPGDAFRVEADRLVLTGCGERCSADFDVTVPRGTAVTGQSTSGEIRLEDTGPIDVRATSGDVEITLREPEDVRANVTSGEIRVTVPDVHYQVRGTSSSGERRIEVVDDPGAQRVLELTTTSGDVQVRRK